MKRLERTTSTWSMPDMICCRCGGAIKFTGISIPTPAYDEVTGEPVCKGCKEVEVEKLQEEMEGGDEV